MEDIEFPGVSLEVKQEEGEDYALPLPETDDFDPPLPLPEMDMIDENLPLKKKRLKKEYICQLCSKSFKDNYKLNRHQKVHVRSGELAEPPQTEVQCLFPVISDKNNVLCCPPKRLMLQLSNS